MSEEYTKEPLAWGIVDPTVDPVQWFKDHLSHGNGDIHCVWIPSHPKTVGEHPRPDHAVLLAITGNGPKSEANAKRIVEVFNGKTTHEWQEVCYRHNSVVIENNSLRAENAALTERVKELETKEIDHDHDEAIQTNSRLRIIEDERAWEAGQ